MLNLDNLTTKPERYVSRESFERNLESQLKMTLQTLDQLRQHAVTRETQLELEFFFYTDSTTKAAELTTALSKIQYRVEHRPSAPDKKLQVVIGWTVRMTMDDDTVLKWTKRMCEIGFEQDCEFDGWGTDPAQ